MDVSASNPPNDLSPPQKALWWLKKGDLQMGAEWETAHHIAQSSEGETNHDWVHALCHLIEHDYGNAAYWFRRAGKSGEQTDPKTVWQEIYLAIR